MLMTEVAVLGECVADAFAEGRPEDGELTLRLLPGGGPANTAVALARLGTRTRFLGRLSRDVFGEVFRAHLRASGVDLSDCVTASEPSTLAVAALDGDGRADYTFHAEGTADWAWSAAELHRLRLDGVSCLHTGSLALVRPPGGRLVEEFLGRAARSATISIDPNVRPALVDPATYRTALPRWCAVADLIKLSADDLAHVWPGRPLAASCDALHEAGAALVVVTLGEGGALVSQRGRRAEVPAVVTQVVDTVGAGDSFTAGFLHRLGRDGHLGGRLDDVQFGVVVDAASFGAAVAARTCAVVGANPPWATDFAGAPMI